MIGSYVYPMGCWSRPVQFTDSVLTKHLHWGDQIMNKTSAVIVLAGSLAFAGAGAAQATVTPSPYPAEQNQGTVSDGTIAPGETVIFSGTGFFPGEI